ncbi:MAG: hypothetical protein WC882_01540 [Candidatus Gracilibacteria bacterium]
MKNKAIENIKLLIKEFDHNISPRLKLLAENAKKLINVCNEVDKSFSGSFAGWHGHMYFKDFQTPQLNQRFSGEWGGINGIPNGWVKKEAKEVKEEIERRMSADFSIKIDDLEKEATAMKEESKKNLNEVKIAFSSINLNKIPKEKELFDKIEKIEFGRDKAYFINKHIPKKLMTRDQGALMEGVCIASHKYYLGLGQSFIDISESIKSFLQLVDQLLRQTEMKKVQFLPFSNNAWNYINPFWIIWQLLLFLLKILKYAWGHRIISILIVMITLLTIDYSLAWKNLLTLLSWIRS